MLKQPFFKYSGNKAAIITLAAAKLPRTGANSPACSLLPSDLMRIASFLETPNFIITYDTSFSVLDAKSGALIKSCNYERPPKGVTMYGSNVITCEQNVTRYSLVDNTRTILASLNFIAECISSNYTCEYVVGGTCGQLEWNIAGTAKSMNFFNSIMQVELVNGSICLVLERGFGIICIDLSTSNIYWALRGNFTTFSTSREENCNFLVAVTEYGSLRRWSCMDHRFPELQLETQIPNMKAALSGKLCAIVSKSYSLHALMINNCTKQIDVEKAKPYTQVIVHNNLICVLHSNGIFVWKINSKHALKTTLLWHFDCPFLVKGIFSAIGTVPIAPALT